MKVHKHFSWIVLLCVAGATVGLFLVMLQRDEPSYQGKSVTFWIHELSEMKLSPQGFPARDTPAKDAIRTIGTNAVPYLVMAIDRRTSVWATEFYARIWTKLPASMQKSAPRPINLVWLRRESARMLAEFVWKSEAPIFEAAVPALKSALNDPDSDLRVVAVSTLGMITTKHKNTVALTALIRALESPHVEVRYHAAWAFNQSGREARQALVPLSRLMQDTNAGVRLNAAFAVYQISGDTNEPIRVHIAGLSGGNFTDRGNAAEHLARIGPPAKSAIPALIEALKDTNQYVHSWALEALKKIDPNSVEEESKR